MNPPGPAFRTTHAALQIAMFCCVLLAPVFALGQQQPELIVEVDRQQVYLGEPIIYNVTVNHVDNPSEPTLEGFDDFGVELLGQRSLNSQQVTIINGVRNEIIRRGMLFQYRLKPTVAGAITIPAPTATVDGDVISGRTVDVTVIAPEEQDVVVLEVKSNRDTVYPLQPFTITLTLAVKQLPGQLASRSPLSVQGREPVKLTAPWLDDQQIPNGLKPTESWRQILEPLISNSRRGAADGVEINNIGSQSAFSLFSSNRSAVFLPPSEIQQLETLDGNQAGYFVYHLERTFEPQRMGDYHFSACSIKGTFGTEIVNQSLDGESIYAVSQPVHVTVRDVPLAGRPDSYTGGVGVFKLSADLSPRTAAVGDPITLSLTVHGQGTIADLRAPDLAQLPRIDRLFRIYEATEETVGNGKTFTWSLRPLEESVTEFPAIPFSYFDVNEEKYVSLASAPLPLTISAAERLSEADVVSAPGSTTGSFQDGLEVNDAGLFANYSGLQMLRSETTRLKQWIPVWLTILMTYAGASVLIRRHQQLRADPSITRRRGARGRASESLQAVVAAAGNEAAVSPDTLSRVVAGMIADFTNRDEAGMTAADVRGILAAAGVDETLKERAGDFMEQCDAARYGGSASSGSLYAECRSLLDQLGQELNRLC